MDPLSLVIAALAAGAAAGVTDSARQGVIDMYQDLRTLIRRRLSRRADGETALERYERDPQGAVEPLRAELVATGAPADEALLAKAQQLLEALERQSDGGKYHTTFHGNVGTAVVGDQSHVAITIDRPRPE